MIGTVIGCAAIFCVSELGGEVYHMHHKNEPNNIAIKVGRRLANGVEAAEHKINETKEQIKLEKEAKNTQDPKKVIVNNEANKNISEILDKQIDKINDAKQKDVSSVLSNAALSIKKAAELLVETKNFDDKDVEDLRQLSAKGQEISDNALNNNVTVANAKKQINALANKVQVYINKNLDIEAAKEPAQPVAESTNRIFTVVKNETEGTIPDFTKPLKPLKKEEEEVASTNKTTVKDIKKTAEKKSAKNK